MNHFHKQLNQLNGTWERNEIKSIKKSLMSNIPCTTLRQLICANLTPGLLKCSHCYKRLHNGLRFCNISLKKYQCGKPFYLLSMKTTA